MNPVHEPHPETREVEERLLWQSHLAVYDAHFADIRQHAHGHGSQEHAAFMAREHPGTLVLGGHHGPIFSDTEIRAAYRRHRTRNGKPDACVAVRNLVPAAKRAACAAVVEVTAATAAAGGPWRVLARAGAVPSPPLAPSFHPGSRARRDGV